MIVKIREIAQFTRATPGSSLVVNESEYCQKMLTDILGKTHDPDFMLHCTDAY